MSKNIFVLYNNQDLAALIRKMQFATIKKGKPVKVTVVKYEPRRSDIQNDKMWPMLRDISRQVKWYGQQLEDYEWKDMFTAALKRQKIVPGIEGGYVAIGERTSRMKVKDVRDLIEFMYAFGAENGVIWSEPKDKKQ